MSVTETLEFNLSPTTPALASIADLSVLEISSRTVKARQSWSAIFKVRTKFIIPRRKLTHGD